MSSKMWRVSLMLFLIIVVNVAQGNSESAKSPYGAEKSAFIAENNPFSFVQNHVPSGVVFFSLHSGCRQFNVSGEIL